MKKATKLKIKNVRLMSQPIQTGGTVTVHGCSHCKQVGGDWVCYDCVPIPN